MLSSRSFTRLGLVSAATAAAVLIGGCDRQSTPSAQPEASAQASASASIPAEQPSGAIDRSHKGETLPAITVTDPAGRSLALPSLKGKPVLINLWATWCAPCVAELPTLDALAARGTLKVLAISQDQQSARVAQFLKDKGAAHLAPWLDPKADMSFHYGGATLPTTILFGADGKEVWRYGGGRDWANAAAAKLLAEAG